jgi:uncharacterized membrane protein
MINISEYVIGSFVFLIITPKLVYSYNMKVLGSGSLIASERAVKFSLLSMIAIGFTYIKIK